MAAAFTFLLILKFYKRFHCGALFYTYFNYSQQIQLGQSCKCITHQIALELFFPQVLAYTDISSIEFLDKEIFTDVTAGETYETDILAKARFSNQDGHFLIHIENQSYKQRKFERRMYIYFARLSEKHALPVYSIAVLSYENPRTPQSNIYRVTFPDKTVNVFDFGIVQLNLLNWRQFLHKENPVAAALMAKMLIAPKDRPKVKFECLRLLSTLRIDKARTKLVSGFVDTYLKLNAAEEQIFQSEIAKLEPVRQEAVMEIVTSWQLQGREEGRQEGKLELVMRQLNRKIGLMAPDVEERIRNITVRQLENLAEALLDFTNSEDLVNWLNELDN